MSIGRAMLDAVIPPSASAIHVRNLSGKSLSERVQTQSNSATGTVRILLPYHDPAIKALVYELKYRRNPRALSLACTLLSEECIGVASELLTPPLLIPVPMHHRRRATRGFNPPDELCRGIVREIHDSVYFAPTVLTRIRHTPPQQTLSRTARLQNVRGSMSAKHTLVHGRTCIVVDDVTTTGATFIEAQRALAAAGATSIYCIALAG